MNQHVLRIAGREYKAEVKELTPERAVVLVDGIEYAVDLVRVGRRTVTADAVRPVAAAPPSAAPVPAAPVPEAAPSARPAVGLASGTTGSRAGRNRAAFCAVGEGRGCRDRPDARSGPDDQSEGRRHRPGRPGIARDGSHEDGERHHASYNGTVSRIYVREGDSISEGDMLVEVARPKMTAL